MATRKPVGASNQESTSVVVYKTDDREVVLDADRPGIRKFLEYVQSKMGTTSIDKDALLLSMIDSMMLVEPESIFKGRSSGVPGKLINDVGFSVLGVSWIASDTGLPFRAVIDAKFLEAVEIQSKDGPKGQPTIIAPGDSKAIVTGALQPMIQLANADLNNQFPVDLCFKSERTDSGYDVQWLQEYVESEPEQAF